jgi:hypothetical protein
MRAGVNKITGYFLAGFLTYYTTLIRQVLLHMPKSGHKMAEKKSVSIQKIRLFW